MVMLPNIFCYINRRCRVEVWPLRVGWVGASWGKLAGTPPLRTAAAPRFHFSLSADFYKALRLPHLGRL
jgi:hypothetical protein